MTEKAMASLPPGALGLAILIATEEKDQIDRVKARLDDPRAYWLTLATECAQAFGACPSDNP